MDMVEGQGFVNNVVQLLMSLQHLQVLLSKYLLNENMMIKCEQVQIHQLVKVRKYSLDNLKPLQELLRNSKCFSNKVIANKLNVPLTKVEHWFRTDKYFAIPDSELWYKLKELLSIKDSTFDKFITEFEIKPNELEMSNRAYLEIGLSPTILTDASINVVVYE